MLKSASAGVRKQVLSTRTNRPSRLLARCISQLPSSSATVHRGLAGHLSRGTASGAALRPLATDQSQETIFEEDLPITSFDDTRVAIGWDTKTWSRFHHIWLRDHCRCSECFHQVTKQRLVKTFEIPADIKPLHITPTLEGLEVHWPATIPHTSFYPWSWLRSSSYDPPMTNEKGAEKILWGAKIAQSPPTVTYEEVMSDSEQGLLKWLSNIDTFGFSFVSGVPVTTEATERLCERISYIRETQYGKFWDFTSDLAKGDTAYTTLALGAHTDNTYYTDPCGLQLFHLLSHTDGSGGATLLVDGFYVASLLKELHPGAYELLTRVPVPAHAAGEEASFYQPHPVYGYPVLREDPVTKALAQVRWNNDDRSVMRHLEPQQVQAWYDAIRIWNKTLKSPDSEFWVQLTPGTAVVVDNHRVLHGRSAFTGKRRMCGAYIGGDEYRSKLATLREKFGNTSTQEEVQQEKIDRSIWHPQL